MFIKGGLNKSEICYIDISDIRNRLVSLLYGKIFHRFITWQEFL